MGDNPAVQISPAPNFLGDAVEISDHRENQKGRCVCQFIARSGQHGHDEKNSKDGSENTDDLFRQLIEVSKQQLVELRDAARRGLVLKGFDLDDCAASRRARIVDTWPR